MIEGIDWIDWMGIRDDQGLRRGGTVRTEGTATYWT